MSISLMIKCILCSAMISGCPRPAYFLAPPTVRLRPLWYLPLLPEIVQLLSRCLRIHEPGLQCLKSFSCTQKDLESDGVHFSALTGFSYIQFLLDEPRFIP